MSHGADTADFEVVLGPRPDNGQPPVIAPIMFLLQDPGKDYGNGQEVLFGGFRKRPPVRHYYWTPAPGPWPKHPDEFGGDFYGPYFAYLMRTHS